MGEHEQVGMFLVAEPGYSDEMLSINLLLGMTSSLYHFEQLC